MDTVDQSLTIKMVDFYLSWVSLQGADFSVKLRLTSSTLCILATRLFHIHHIDFSDRQENEFHHGDPLLPSFVHGWSRSALDGTAIQGI